MAKKYEIRASSQYEDRLPCCYEDFNGKNKMGREDGHASYVNNGNSYTGKTTSLY